MSCDKWPWSNIMAEEVQAYIENVMRNVESI